MAGEGGKDDAEGPCGNAKPHENAAAEMQPEGRCAEGHADEARRIKKAGEHEHAARTELIGDGAEEGLAETPEEVLQRHGKTEG